MTSRADRPAPAHSSEDPACLEVNACPHGPLVEIGATVRGPRREPQHGHHRRIPVNKDTDIRRPAGNQALEHRMGPDALLDDGTIGPAAQRVKT